jgi:hypothetical protein
MSPHFTQRDKIQISMAIGEWYQRAVLQGADLTSEQFEAIDMLATATIPPDERLHMPAKCPECGYSVRMGEPFFGRTPLDM